MDKYCIIIIIIIKQIRYFLGNQKMKKIKSITLSPKRFRPL